MVRACVTRHPQGEAVLLRAPIRALNKPVYLHDKIPCGCLKENFKKAMEKSPASILKLMCRLYAQVQHSLVQLRIRLDPFLSSLILIAPSGFSAQENCCQGTNSPPLGHLPHLTSNLPDICWPPHLRAQPHQPDGLLRSRSRGAGRLEAWGEAGNLWVLKGKVCESM